MDGDLDILYWHNENDGNYSVKSAYRLIQRRKGLVVSMGNSSIWQQLWKIKAPPKVLNMVWRALSASLPTKSNLFSRSVPVHPVCPVCNAAEETTFHILVECEFAAQCWARRGSTYQGEEASCFAEWLGEMFKLTSKDELADIVTLCWAIWRARNNLVWNQKQSSVSNVVLSMKQYLADWKSAQLNTTKALYQYVEHGDGAHAWVSPVADEVKITVDAAIFAEDTSFGVGLLARNSSGEVLHGSSQLYQGEVRPDFAEAIAVKEALSWCKTNSWQKVTVETDCLSVVQAIRSKVTMFSPFGRIIMECRTMIQDLNIGLFFIKRSANMAAHLIARESCSFPGRVFDGRSVPISLVPILLNDSRV